MFIFHLFSFAYTHSQLSTCQSILTCTRLPFACIHLHTFVPVCFQPLVCVYFCAFSFTLTCSYLYTDWSSPIGFFFICTHLSRPPAHQLLFVHICTCLCLFMLIHTHRYSFALVHVRRHSFVLFCTCLCLPALVPTGTTHYCGHPPPFSPTAHTFTHLHSFFVHACVFIDLAELDADRPRFGL